MSTQLVRASLWAVGLLCGWLGGGCAAIYPEIATPVGKPPGSGEVTPAPPDDYALVYVKSATIPRTTRNGRPWGDGKDSLPSSYAVFFIDGQEVYRTDVARDTMEPTWPTQKKANYRLKDETKLKFEIWENHGLLPHPICDKELKKPANFIESGEVQVSCPGGASFTIAIEPAKPLWGLGLFYELQSTAVMISRVIPASSAGRAGIKAGDRIIEIMGHPIGELDDGQVQTLMRVNAARGLSLTLQKGQQNPRKVTIKESALYATVDDRIDLM